MVICATFFSPVLNHDVTTPSISSSHSQSTDTFADQRSLFKKYDLRGNQALFTPKFIASLAFAFADLYETCGANTVVVGYDARHASLSIAQKIAEALKVKQIEVVWLGLVPTPLMAFWADRFAGHGIIATASHSSKDVLGIKWQIAGKSPTPEQITSLFQHITCSSLGSVVNTFAKPKAHTFNAQPADFFPAYTSAIQNALAQLSQHLSPFPSSHRPLQVVVDCLNGATGRLAQYVLTEFSDWFQIVEFINAEPDGSFPYGNPDPTESGRLATLSLKVVSNNADLGIAFDGDGDRLAVVDNEGKVLAPDVLLYFLAKVAVADEIESPTSNTKDHTKPKVLFDVKCSHHLPTLLDGLGVASSMVQTGSSLLRQAVANDATVILAGELSGHYIFNDATSKANGLAGHDDALYASVRLLHWLAYQLAKDKQTLSDRVNRLPMSVATGDIYVPLPTSEPTASGQSNQPILSALKGLGSRLVVNSNALKNKLGLPADCRATLTDGIRLDFAQGFGIIRPSNTSPSLTVRFAANTLSDLQWVQGVFVNLMREIDAELAKRIAQIEVGF